MNNRAQQRRFGISTKRATTQAQHRAALCSAVDEGGAYAVDARRRLAQLAVHDYTESQPAAGRALTARAKGRTDRDSVKYFAAKNADPLKRRH